MFGGAGLYHRGIFFAILFDDFLYFKVDDRNRPDYLAANMEPFRPYPDRKVTFQYYRVPADVLEDRRLLRAWAEKAVGAARDGRATPPRKTSKRRERRGR